MKKKRCLPFGYKFQYGTIIVNKEEAAIVQFIFNEYSRGASLQKLADSIMLTEQAYAENSVGWDKNRVRRILENEKYYGIDSHLPALISAETFCLAKSRRQGYGYHSSKQLQSIRKKMTCSHCSATIYRNSKSAPTIYWDCKQCGARFGPVNEQELMDAITSVMNVTISNPAVILKPEAPHTPISLQAAKLSNDIRWGLGQKQVDQEKIVSLIFECAAEIYKTCSADIYHPNTLQIKSAIEKQALLEEFDVEFFNRITGKVILQPDKTVILRLKNGVNIN